MNITNKLAEALRDSLAYVQDAAGFPEQFKPGVVKRHERAALDALAAYDAHKAGTGSAPAGEHTAEPWQVTAYQKNALTIVSDDYVQNGIIAVVNAGRNYRHPQADANARRIVACVNFMAGTPTHHIEVMTAARETFDDYTGGR